jgi:hypothetical protein
MVPWNTSYCRELSNQDQNQAKLLLDLLLDYFVRDDKYRKIVEHLWDISILNKNVLLRKG